MPILGQRRQKDAAQVQLGEGCQVAYLGGQVVFSSSERSKVVPPSDFPGLWIGPHSFFFVAGQLRRTGARSGNRCRSIDGCPSSESAIR